VFEIASEGTWRDDLDDKYDLYEKLGVKEYFLFDPESRYLVPQLQGFRRQGTVFRRIRQSDLTSELGFGLRAEDTMLRLIDLQTGQPILTRAEAVLTAREQANAAVEQARTAVEQARTAEEQARTALEQANVAQLQASIARQLAQSEKERADALQAELNRLCATMDKAHGESGSST
jgi:hypothetical protein